MAASTQPHIIYSLYYIVYANIILALFILPANVKREK